MKHDDFSGILQRVRAFCEAEALLTPLAAGKPLHLAAAVSGGADSMALLHLLLALQAESGFVLSVCHVNHGLRGETADRDEAFVREACAELGLPLRVFRPAEVGFTVPPHAGEDWARRLRYACFEQLRQEGIDCIATAHLMASHLTREQLLRAPAMLLPQQGYALEEVRLSVERLEGYILQCQAQQNDTPAARCGRLAVAYINEHYADCDLKLPDVLEHLGVSRSYFSTVFKEKTGQSFVEYLTNLRMEKAKEYLRETGLCTYEIAERIGFADPHYFSLSFRRRTGMTPKQYREAETKQ